MINYYYQIQDGGRILGKEVKYLAYYDVHPNDEHWSWTFHDTLMKVSDRVWLENANGVQEIKAPKHDRRRGYISEAELVWLKLRCRDVTTL